MSPKRSPTISELVRKYRAKYPKLERDVLRKLIRLENPKLFLNRPSNLKTLDRWMKRSFQKPSGAFTEGDAVLPEQLRKVYDEVLQLRIHPPEHIRENGTTYLSHSEFDKALDIFVSMHPRLREVVNSALKQSQLKNSRSVKWVGDMTTMEIDALLGQLGQVLDELKEGKA